MILDIEDGLDKKEIRLVGKTLTPFHSSSFELSSYDGIDRLPLLSSSRTSRNISTSLSTTNHSFYAISPSLEKHDSFDVSGLIGLIFAFFLLSFYFSFILFLFCIIFYFYILFFFFVFFF
jgi:hypothetical protein